MRYSIVIIIFTFLSCSKTNSNDQLNKNEGRIILKAIRKNSFDPRGNVYEVKIINPTTENLTIWAMNCNYNENFTTNNSNIFFGAIECNKNFPFPFEIKPKEETHFKLIIMSNAINKQKFKIGYFVINNLKNINFTSDEYEKRIKNKTKYPTIWSNELEL